jgi:hypothetical protein
VTLVSSLVSVRTQGHRENSRTKNVNNRTDKIA